MIHQIVSNDDKTVLTISFSDEGVDVEQSIHVDGNEQKALSYLPFFERDIRRDHAHLFPIAEVEGGVIE